jgi:hypothetical protein
MLLSLSSSVTLLPLSLLLETYMSLEFLEIVIAFSCPLFYLFQEYDRFSILLSLLLREKEERRK